MFSYLYIFLFHSFISYYYRPFVSTITVLVECLFTVVPLISIFLEVRICFYFYLFYCLGYFNDRTLDDSVQEQTTINIQSV